MTGSLHNCLLVSPFGRESFWHSFPDNCANLSVRKGTTLITRKYHSPFKFYLFFSSSPPSFCWNHFPPYTNERAEQVHTWEQTCITATKELKEYFTKPKMSNRAVKFILLPLMHKAQQSLHLQAETDSRWSLFQKQSLPQSPLPIRGSNCRKGFLCDCSPSCVEYSTLSRQNLTSKLSKSQLGYFYSYRVKICKLEHIYVYFFNKLIHYQMPNSCFPEQRL